MCGEWSPPNWGWRLRSFVRKAIVAKAKIELCKEEIAGYKAFILEYFNNNDKKLQVVVSKLEEKIAGYSARYAHLLQLIDKEKTRIAKCNKKTSVEENKEN